MDGHAQGSFSVPTFRSLAVSDVCGPKWIPRGQRQLDLLAQGTLQLHNYRPRGGGGERRSFPCQIAILERYQLMSGKDDSCQQEGGGAMRQISQQSSQERNKNKRSVLYGGCLH